jgi:hypothetical protein
LPVLLSPYSSEFKDKKSKVQSRHPDLGLLR